MGTPSLIACDVSPIPDSVQKIAASFNARVYSPQRSIREEEKRQVAQIYSLSSSSAHERDALTAAVYAYREHQNRLRQIELLSDFSKEEREALSHMVLNGFTLRRAIISLSQKTATGLEEKPMQKIFQQKLSFSQLESQLQKSLLDISRLSHENSNLKKALDFATNQLSSLRNQLRLLENGVSERLRRDSEVRKLRFENERLRDLIAKITGSRGHKQKGKGHGQGAERGSGGQEKGAQKANPNADSKAGLNSLSENKLDLGTLVEEYRSNRH